MSSNSIGNVFAITFFGDITTPTRLALLAESTEIKERGTINALIAIPAGISVIIVVAGSGYIMDFVGPDFVFYYGGISLMISGIIFFMICRIKTPKFRVCFRF